MNKLFRISSDKYTLLSLPPSSGILLNTHSCQVLSGYFKSS